MDKIVNLLDTTLRDGQLAPEVNFSTDESIDVAVSLVLAGVDVIELAFPGLRTQDIPSTREIVEQVKTTTLCCLARTELTDIEIAADTLSACSNPRLHLYLDSKSIRVAHAGDALSDIALKVKDMVSYARNLVPEVEFSPQDATRLETDSLVAVVRAALEGGARIINLSDTTGTSSPAEIETLFRQLIHRIPELDDAIISLHAHDHRGNAIDNVLSAIQAGARQIEGTVNGIGPAGGNTDIVQVVERLHQEPGLPSVSAQVDCQQLQLLARRLPKRPG